MNKVSYIKVWKDNHGAIPKGYHIHHIDGNHENNSIDNLICVSREMHAAFHQDRYDNLGLSKDAWAATLLGQPTGETWNKGMKTMIVTRTGPHTDEAKIKMSDAAKAAWAIRLQDSEVKDTRKTSQERPWLAHNILINNVEYPSVREASRVLGLGRKYIANRLKDNTNNDFRYVS